jgi:DNA repair protein RadC
MESMMNLQKLSDAALVSQLVGRPVQMNFSLLEAMGFDAASEHKVCESVLPGQYSDVITALRVARELTARAMEQSLKAQCQFKHPGQVQNYLRALLAGKTREEFWCLWLDGRNALIASELLSVGTLSQTSVYPREVVASALRHNASSVVFAHQHPSNEVQPSRADERLTFTLKEALALIDVRVIDHFVVGAEGVYSFAENGLI